MPIILDHGPHRSRILAPLIGAAISVVALLSACAPSAPSPVVTHHPAAHATVPAGLHSATPLPQPPTPPQLLGGNCTTLATLPVIRAALTSNAVVPVSSDASGEPSVGTFESVAARQTGTLFCGWADPTQSFDLDVEIIPNAAAAFTAESTALNAAGDATGHYHVVGVPTYGDQSWSECYGATESPEGACEFDIRVGSYWLSIQEQNSNLHQPYPQTAAETTLLDDLVSSVRALPAFRVWTPSTSVPTLPTTCSAFLPLSTVRTATGDTAIAPETFGFEVDDVPWILTNSLFCEWGGTSSVDLFLTIVPGSAWAGQPSANVSGTTSQPGLGSQASGGCVTSDGQHACELLVRAGDTWFDLTENGTSASLTLAPLTNLAHAVLTAVGFS